MKQDQIDTLKRQEAYLLSVPIDFNVYKLKLTIDIFPFYLYQRQLSKLTMVKQEIMLLKSMKDSISKENALFRTYFFNSWEVSAKKLSRRNAVVRVEKSVCHCIPTKTCTM